MKIAGKARTSACLWAKIAISRGWYQIRLLSTKFFHHVLSIDCPLQAEESEGCKGKGPH